MIYMAAENNISDIFSNTADNRLNRVLKIVMCFRNPEANNP